MFSRPSYTYTPGGKLATRIWARGIVTSYGYDAAGSLTNIVYSDGRGWHYAWNGENRMVCASNADVVVTYAYDHRGRMVRKDIKRRAAESQSITYTWDDWNIVREALVARHSLLVTHNVWGLDIDGTLQGAGGVGGLLAVIREDGVSLPAYDANGNITEYVDAAGGSVVACYAYSTFGEPFVLTGPFTDMFTYRFATKPYCIITKLCDYQKRMYASVIGRWLSKDPINDMRSHLTMSLSLVSTLKHDEIRLNESCYLFCKNNSMLYIDPDGQTAIALPSLGGAVLVGVVISLSPDIREAVINLIAIAGEELDNLARTLDEKCPNACCRFGWHGAHHSFPDLGHRCHFQVTCWLKGIGKTQVIKRHPLENGLCPPFRDWNTPEICARPTF